MLWTKTRLLGSKYLLLFQDQYIFVYLSKWRVAKWLRVTSIISKTHKARNTHGNLLYNYGGICKTIDGIYKTANSNDFRTDGIYKTADSNDFRTTVAQLK